MTSQPPPNPAPVIIIREILEKTSVFFAGKGIASPRLDAELLIAHVLGLDRLRLYLNLDRPLDPTELDQARALVRRRATFEPVAYIVGKKEFAGRDFKVGPGVLVPRPDTEILVDHATSQFKARFAAVEGPINILEFGVGSGAIAVTLAADLPNARITATDISEQAVAYARDNAQAHAVADRIDIRVQPDFAGIAGPFQAIISNPPYIAPDQGPTLAPDVANHEPHQALFAEDNGLKWYHFLAAEATRLLAPEGFIAVEIGYDQGEAVKAIFEQHDLKNVRIQKDYAQHDRVVLGAKSEC